MFSDKEMAAISWADSVTNISAQSDMDSKLKRLLEHFSESEAVDLTVIVSVMNSLNRLAISFGDRPEAR